VRGTRAATGLRWIRPEDVRPTRLPLMARVIVAVLTDEDGSDEYEQCAYGYSDGVLGMYSELRSHSPAYENGWRLGVYVRLIHT